MIENNISKVIANVLSKEKSEMMNKVKNESKYVLMCGDGINDSQRWLMQIAIGILKQFGISINPMIESLAMVISSLTVILNALRLKRIKI